MSLKAANAISKAYNGRTNFLTPARVKCGEAYNLYYEISRGTGIAHERIYGLTVIEKNGTKRPDLSRCFNGQDCYASMMRYIENGFSF
jgi:hypothetical protein